VKPSEGGRSTGRLSARNSLSSCACGGAGRFSRGGLWGSIGCTPSSCTHVQICVRCLGSCLQLLVMPSIIWSVPTITTPWTLPCPLSGSLFVHCSGSTYIPARLPLYVVMKCGTSHVQDRVAWRIPNQATSLPYQDRSTPKTAHSVTADCLHSGLCTQSPPGSPVCPLDRIGSISALLRFALAVHTILLAHSCPLSFGLCHRHCICGGAKSSIWLMA
jgi:hypothetical protein